MAPVSTMLLITTRSSLSARWSARSQAVGDDVVTTLRHTRVELPADPHAVLRLLDGARDRSALLAALPWTARDGDCAARLEDALEWLAANALLRG